MNDLVFNVGGFSLYATGMLVVFSFLWGSFVFYKKAIETHLETEAVLDMIVLGAFWGFMVARVGYLVLHLGIFWKHWSRLFLLVNYPGLDGWGFLIGLILGVCWVVKKNKYKYIDVMDLLGLGVLSGASLFWVGFNLINFGWQYLLCGILLFIGFLCFWDLEKKYRLIGWYRAQKTSAKSGFVAGFSLVYLNLVFVLGKILLQRMTLVAGLWSAVLVVIGLSLVYIRSGRVWTDDINSLMIWKKKTKK